MKKTLILMILVFAYGTFFSISTQAVSGDIAGTIYSTDIKACINGVWVDSYNIGGKTVVVVEDITNQSRYSDAIRTLVINEFNPECLVSGGKSYNQKSGTPVGKIYETDIKTYFRGKELTSYSLNGKMAIEIEELGDNGEFSDIGGKYIWNADERTISLESMYRYPYEMRNMLEDAHYNIELNYSDEALTAKFAPSPLLGGQILCEKIIPDNTIIPVLHNEEIIGYRCKFPETVIMGNENGEFWIEERQMDVDHFYVDKVEAIVSDTGAVIPTVQDWLNYYEYNTLSKIEDSFETDDYMFLYLFSAHTHGGTESLVKLNKADGSRISYDKHFESVSLYNQKYFENVVIDRENEKVYLHYDVDYVIDLKTDEIKPVNEAE